MKSKPGSDRGARVPGPRPGTRAQSSARFPARHRPTRIPWLGAALALGALAPLATRGGGISLYEIATPDVGLASAGYASRAEDASTVFKNPAGMNRLEGSQVQGGLQLLYGQISFSRDAQTSARLGTDDGGNAVGAMPAASLFYVQELNEQWRVGFGLLSYFGLAQHYNDNWVGRYYIQEGSLIGVSLTPSVSYQATEWLSVGAGLNAMAGYLHNQMAINNVAPGFGDGQLELKDHAWGFGANAGVLIEPWKGTRFGVAYLSRVNLGFKATPTMSNLGPGMGALFDNPPELNLGVTVPQSVMLSGYHDLNDQWAIMADVGWQNWSQFGKVDVGADTVNPSSLTVNLNYQNTWHGAVGAQYHLSEAWTLTGGVAYDTSAVTSQDRTVTLPMGQAWRFGAGARWQVSERVELGAAYEFLWIGDMAVSQGTDLSLRGRVSGSYNDARISVFTLNLTW